MSPAKLEMRLRPVSRLFIVLLILSLGTRADAKDNAVQVPFVLQNGGIVLQVRIAGAGPFNMLLSTNTEVSKISLQVLNSLHLLPNVANDPTSVNPDATILYRDLPNVQVGELKLSRLAALVFDPQKISQRLDLPIDGILGYNFFEKRVVQIDYPNKIVRILPEFPKGVVPGTGTEGNTLHTSGEVPLSIETDNPVSIIDGILIAGKKLRALLDTGQGGTLALTPSAVKYLGLPPAVSNAPPESVKIGAVNIGSAQFDLSDVVLLTKESGIDHGLKKYGAIIGNGMLDHCVVTLDYRRKVILINQH